MTDSSRHQTVFLQQAVAALNIKKNGVYVDCTYGRGGHSKLILQNLGNGGKLIVIDCDLTAIASAKMQFAADTRVLIVHSNFENLSDILTTAGIDKADGIIADFGVSSPQLDTAERGFSFSNDGPVDMRMDKSKGETAAQWLATVSEAKLASVIKTYGEERFAKAIARKIIADKQCLNSTAQLAKCIDSAVKIKPKRHSATKTFQAIRIYINNELSAIDNLLQQAKNKLQIGGRLVVISFHSLEDRIVKTFINKLCSKPQQPPAYIPIKNDFWQPSWKKAKALKTSAVEVQQNHRSRSAIMRVVENINYGK